MNSFPSPSAIPSYGPITKDAIRNLLLHLPSPCTALASKPVAKSPLYASKTAQAAFALNAPDFGWHYVRFWLDAQLNLPSMVNQHSIYLMFMHFAGCLIKDELPQTLELREPNSTFTRIAVEAYSLVTTQVDF